MFEDTPVARLAIGRSIVRRRILALLMAEPAVRLHLREIQRRAGTTPGTASRELARLVSAGLIEREAEGSLVYFRGSAAPFATMMRSLLVAPAAAPANPGPAVDAYAELAEQTANVPQVNRPETSAPAGASLAIQIGAAPGARADPLALDAVGTFATQLRSIYGERLRGIYLYGPRASGDAPPDSNVDLLVVLDRIERYGEELERTSTLCASISLELEVVVSRIFVSEADWRDRTDGPLPEARAEAVPL